MLVVGTMTFTALAAWPDVDEPLKTGGSAPAEAAIVIGNEDYAFLPDVPYAKRDALAFYRFLLYTRGLPPGNVRLLDQGANREMVLGALAEVRERVGADGTVWVYFAGHGAASPSTGERLLLGDDARGDLAAFESRGLTVSEIRRAATANGAQAMLVLDTCYTGQGRQGGDLVAGKRFAVPAWNVAVAERVTEWSAAGPNSWSGPIDEARHGAFTWLVLGALRGWADGQLDNVRDGVVTATEADLYVADALRTLGIDGQRPVLAGKTDVVLNARATEGRPDLAALRAPPPPVVAPPEVVAAAVPAASAEGTLDPANRGPINAIAETPVGDPGSLVRADAAWLDSLAYVPMRGQLQPGYAMGGAHQFKWIPKEYRAGYDVWTLTGVTPAGPCVLVPVANARNPIRSAYSWVTVSGRAVAVKDKKSPCAHVLVVDSFRD